MSITLTKVRRIGNSRGILFPKTVLEESGIKGTVQITVKDRVIIIKSADVKKGKKWSDFKKARKQKADVVINEFDSADWTW
jgi:antitoxin component of MazEF toxin-antitoxin module